MSDYHKINKLEKDLDEALELLNVLVYWHDRGDNIPEPHWDTVREYCMDHNQSTIE